MTATGSETATSEIDTTVCLVDDDASVRKSIGRLLESAGYQVRSFAKPEEFLNHLMSHQVPLVVVDIWMENMTGMELLAHLCARSPQTRAIFITGHEDTAAERTVMQAGAFAFFLKPLDSEQFLDSVRSALKELAIDAG
ncbi:MAG TPA: response regulator [Chthoniobacterales bacterium]|jgi:FixJ family two-component response regulator